MYSGCYMFFNDRIHLNAYRDCIKKSGPALNKRYMHIKRFDGIPLNAVLLS